MENFYCYLLTVDIGLEGWGLASFSKGALDLNYLWIGSSFFFGLLAW